MCVQGAKRRERRRERGRGVLPAGGREGNQRLLRAIAGVLAYNSIADAASRSDREGMARVNIRKPQV